jgi:beta-lactamase regulating signal transducer with metallopeptidase domain/protocatechuate 3,4-dioxygenase beta subunit
MAMTWRLLVTGPLSPANFALTWLLQSTVLLAFGLIAGRLLKRSGPAVQSAWYRTTLAAVLLCPSASMLLTTMGFTGLMVHLPADGADGQSVSPPIVTRDSSTAGWHAPLGEEKEIDAPAESMAASSPVVPPLTTSPPIQSSIAPSPRLPKLGFYTDMTGWGVSLCLAVWLLGSTILAARLFAGHRRMARLRACAVQAEPDAEALCNDLATRMGLSLPLVLRTPFLSSPCLDGLRRPAILLPEDAEANLRETFVHELAHLARRDGLWNLLRRTATALLWAQPLLWVLSRRMEVTAEEVCDDYVVQFGADRARYAGLLLDLAERTLPPLAPAGVGMISLRSLLARRVTRILDSSRTLSTRAGARAIAATLLAGLVGTLLAGLIGVGGRSAEVLADEPKSEKPPPAVNPSPNTPRRTVKGRVVDPEGKPVAGAIVTVGQYHTAVLGLLGNQFADRREVDRAISDRQGHFSLSFEDIDPGSPEGSEVYVRWSVPKVVAWAPGFGPAFPETFARDVTEDKPIQLVRDDVPITGRVVDLEGRPVSGATVQLHSLVCAQSTEDVDRWLAEAANEPAGGTRPQRRTFPRKSGLAGCEPAAPAPAMTNRDGRFRLTGLGRDRLADVDITGPSIAFRRFQIVTRPIKRVENKGAEGSPLFDLSFYGADCTLVVEPGRTIEGVVRDADTKTPIPGATVTGQMLGGSIRSIEGLNVAVTDSLGHYRLDGLPKGNGHRLIVYPSLDHPYFITDRLEVRAGPGLEAVQFDIALKRGLWITGKVQDAKTGRPVQSAIHYYPFLANKRAEAFPYFRPGLSANWTGNRYRTDVDGRFRVVGLPGRGIVAAKSLDRSYRVGVGAESIPERPSQQSMAREALPTYNQIHPLDFHAIAEVNPPDGVEEFSRDLALEPSPLLTVRILDPSGQPITGARVSGRFPARADSGDRNLYDRSQTQIFGLDPKLPRIVVFEHDKRKLGAVLTIKPGDAAGEGERSVTLQPCATVTSRLVDADGNPVAGGVFLGMARPGGVRDSASWRHTESLDADGRFRIDNLPPGGTYTIHATDRLIYTVRREPRRFQQFELTGKLSVGPGQVIDLGTFNAVTGKPIKAPEKQAAVEAKDVPITGRIVDLEGRPIAGVVVRVTRIMKAKGDDLTPWLDRVRRGEPPETAYGALGGPNEEFKDKKLEVATDEQGRFRFQGLGAEQVVELKIQGPTIVFSAPTVVTRPIKPIAARGFPSQYGIGTEMVYGADFTHTVAPSRPVAGVVRDAKTHQPMAGVDVQSYRFAGSDFIRTMDLKTTTDAAGRFRLVGLPKGRGNLLLLVPNDDEPYFMREFAVPDTTGIAPVEVEIELHRGIWITGKVLDKATGQPVAKGRVRYFPFLENTFAQATPEFNKDGSTDASVVQDRYLSKADGTFRLVGLPGPAIVGVVVHNKPYRQGAGSEKIKGMNDNGYFATWRQTVWPGRSWPTSMKEIDPPAGAEGATLDLELEPGAPIRMRVVDRQGKPVTGVTFAGRTGNVTYETDTKPEAEVDVLNLIPHEQRIVMLRHHERGIGKIVQVREGNTPKGPVVVTLEPMATITGCVLDADGNPVSGATVRTDLFPGRAFNLSLGQVATDNDGRFRVPEAPTGCQYTLVVESGATVGQRKVAFFEKASVRPGQVTDVGEIRFKGD